jgi:hypothetical protein
MWDDELVAVNFLGLGKMPLFLRLVLVSNLWHLFYTNVLLLPERHIPVTHFNTIQVHFHDALFTPDKFYENRKIGL